MSAVESGVLSTSEILSAIYKKNLKPGLAVVGNISIGGAVERALNFADKVTSSFRKRCKNGFQLTFYGKPD